MRAHPEGGWYVLEPRGCDHCGAVTFEGGGEPVPMGETCLELTAPAEALAALIWERG